MIVHGMNNRMSDLILPLILASLLFVLSCKQQENRPVGDEQNSVPEYEGTIIAMGDSLTAGLGVAVDDAYPARLEQLLQEAGYNWQVINGGISGETSSGALSRTRWILARHPDIVILETGANDALRGLPLSLVRENIMKTVQMFQEGGVKVVLAGMQIVQNLGADYTKRFAAIYPAVARERQVILIPFFLEGVAGDPSLNQEDTIHPNQKGYRIVARTVLPYVVQAIKAEH
jgi:acyl-CoA thioesterase-1